MSSKPQKRIKIQNKTEETVDSQNVFSQNNEKNETQNSFVSDHLYQASLVLNMREKRKDFLSMCYQLSNELFIINMSDQAKFFQKFSGFTKEISRERTSTEKKKKRSFISTTKNPLKAEIEIVLVTPQELQSSLLTIGDFSVVLARIITESSWLKDIQYKREIPYTLTRYFTSQSIALKTIFPNLLNYSDFLCQELTEEQETWEESLCIFLSISDFIYFDSLLQQSSKTEIEKEVTQENDNNNNNNIDSNFDMSDLDDALSETSIKDIVDEHVIEDVCRRGGITFADEKNFTVQYNKIKGTSQCLNPKNRSVSRTLHDPYAISSTVFAVCNLVSYNMRCTINSSNSYPSTYQNKWLNAKLLYHLAFDWLNDQIMANKVNLPLEVFHMLRGLLYRITGLHHSEIEQNNDSESRSTYYWQATNWFLEYFKRISPVLRQFHGYNPNTFAKKWSKNKAVLINYNLKNFDEWIQHYQMYTLHPYYKQSCDRQPALIYRRNIADPVILEFLLDSNIKVLQLYTTMKLLEYHFNGTESLWDLFYDSEKCYVIVSSEWRRKWTIHCLPYMAYSERSIHRETPFPVYPVYLINYFKGGSQGILSCMKFIIRTFCVSKDETNEKLMATDENDKCVQGYAIFHIIISRFRDSKTIWNKLVYPFSEDQSSVVFNSRSIHNKIPFHYEEQKDTKKGKSRPPKKVLDYHLCAEGIKNGTFSNPLNHDTKKSKICGLQEETFTLYSAIRSFIHCKTKHYVLPQVVDNIFAMFMEVNPSLQIKYPLVFSLIKLLGNIGPEKNTEYITIPTCARDFPQEFWSEMDEKLFEFSLPLQFILYFFCISADIDDEFAMYIFINIVTKFKHKTKTTSVIFSFKDSKRIEKLRPVISKYDELMLNTVSSKGCADPCPGAGGLKALLSHLEELSLYPLNFSVFQIGQDKECMFRGHRKEPELLTYLSADDILNHSQEIISKIPIESKTDAEGQDRYYYLESSLPVFVSEIFQKSDLDTGYNTRSYFFNGHLPPFYSSKDFLENVLMYPIVNIQCLASEDCSTFDNNKVITRTTEITEDVCPYDFRATTLCVKNYGNDPTTSSPRINRITKKWNEWLLKLIEDRNGWTFHPSLAHLTAQGKKFAKIDLDTETIDRS